MGRHIHAAVAALVLVARPALAAVQEQDPDIGYNLLFESSSEEFSDRCVQLPKGSEPFPAWVTGDFIIPSLGKMELGGKNFVGILDGYGKLQRFAINGSTVCATYRMMATSFYNESIKEDTVGRGLLFYETAPPRSSCPILDPMCNLVAPNDNNFVNTFSMGSKLMSLSDTPKMLEVDPKSLAVERVHKFDDSEEGMMTFGASAHPLQHPVTGGMIDFVASGDMISRGANVAIYQLNRSDPTERKPISSVHFESGPYMHSFGVTGKHVVLPRMPITFDRMSVLDHPISAAFDNIDVNQQAHANSFAIVPLDGGEATWRDLPADEKLYYVHTVNSYENATDIILDLTTQESFPFISNGVKVSANKDKALRDQNAHIAVKRFVIPLDENKPISSSVISDPKASTDFTRINPRMQSKEYCFYWAVQWFHDYKSYASMAIVKRDLCSSSADIMWSREFWYVSEPTMIPSTEPGAREDEGVVVFTALDGPNNQSFLVSLDARTMELRSQAGPFPRIAFTTHGQFYEHGTWTDEDSTRSEAQRAQSLFV